MNYIQPKWPAPPCIQAYTTVRTGWDGRREEGNLPLKSLLQLPQGPLWLTQTHSNTVIDAAQGCQGQQADASFTSKPNQVCAILTADCLPVLLCHKQGSHVAAIHAGWRGLASGIIENTLAAMGLPGESLLAWLGPAIGPQCFEVGQDVYEAFTREHAAAAVAFRSHTADKWLANLYELASIRLRLLNVSQIYGGDYCTFTQEALFFSHRRDKGKTGRMASLIWISP